MIPNNLTEARRFILERQEDVTGLSGIGTVADGVLWDDGKVTIHWRGKHRSTADWDSMNDALAIHGHEGKTVPVFVD